MGEIRIFLIATFLSLLLTNQIVQGVCPPMYTRADWGAVEPLKKIPMPGPVPNLVIHHSATRTCLNETDCSALLRSFQVNHIIERGWDDIAYSFLIGGDGNLYEGRGWGRQVQGTQPPEWNYLGYTFCLIGTFEDELPTENQIRRVQELIQCAVDENYSIANYTLRGHRDVYSQTACPGQALYEHIQTWPNYNITSR